MHRLLNPLSLLNPSRYLKRKPQVEECSVLRAHTYTILIYDARSVHKTCVVVVCCMDKVGCVISLLLLLLLHVLVLLSPVLCHVIHLM